MEIKPTIETGKVKTTLKLDNPQEGDRILVLVSAKLAADKPRVSLIALKELTIKFPPEVTIDKTSNFDINAQILTLVVQGSRKFQGTDIFEFQHTTRAAAQSGAEAPFTKIVPTSYYGSRAILRTSASVSSDSTFIVRVSESDSTDGISTPLWQLGPLVTESDLDIGEVTSKWTDKVSLEVEWQYKKNDVDVAFTLFSETASYAARPQPVVSCRNEKTMLSIAPRSNPVESGSKFVCFYMVRSGNYVGKRGCLEVTAP